MERREAGNRPNGIVAVVVLGAEPVRERIDEDRYGINHINRVSIQDAVIIIIKIVAHLAGETVGQNHRQIFA